MGEITFVLPAHRKDISLVREILLPSFDKWMDVACVRRFIIICPEDHVGSYRECGDSFSKLRIDVISEGTLLKGTFTTKNSWYIQQMLKLNACGLIETEWYCTLDADVFLFKRTGYEDFIKNGRAIFNNEPISEHPLWWERSSAYLKIPISVLQVGFGATPSLLHTATCVDMKQQVDIEAALSTGATEYTLYWLYLNAKRNVFELYSGDAEHTLYCQNSLWGAKQLQLAHALGGVDVYVTAKCNPTAKYCFFVFQSILRSFSINKRLAVIASMDTERRNGSYNTANTCE